MKRLLCVLLLLASGCSSAELMEHMDQGIVYEKEARELERNDQPAQAAERFAQGEVEYKASLAIALERQTQVFVSFLSAKLSIVSTGQGRCLRPDINPAGDWKTAYEHYVRAGSYAQRVSLEKMRANSLIHRAECVRPDNDSAGGDWERAIALYAEAGEVSKSFDDHEGRAIALREQAICLLEGDTTRELTPDARRLLEKARKLGDEQAADLLASSEGRYCNACGSAMKAKDKFCTRCGHDQSEPERAPEKRGERMRAPGEPGGPPPR